MEVKPLSAFSEGAKVVVNGISGGKGASKKLYEMGIVPGVTVQIVQGRIKHPYILKVGESRIMLGWGMVQQIFVREKEG